MEEIASVSLRIGAGAHRGLVREENQDRISRLLSPFGDVFVVADGMGGHEGGATAAQLLIDRLGQHLRALPPGMPPDEALRQAATQTNADICERAQDNPRLAKMGATVVLALIQGSRAWIAHAGDSRAYLWRDGQLARLTRDHTLVQRMVDHQILNEEEARNHPDSNVVTRAFGQNPQVEIEVAPPLELADGDRLLLCSDGLSGYVDDAAIAQALAEGGDAQALADALIDLALRAGGEDNVSVQILAVQEEAEGAEAVQTAATSSHRLSAPPPGGEAPAKEPRRGLSGFLLVLPLMLVAALAGFLLPWRDWLSPAPPEPDASEAAVPEAAAPEPASSGTSELSDPTDPFAGPLTEPAPESSPPPQPRITVVSPSGATAPEVKQRVLRAYPANWSTPELLDGRLAGALEEGRVYFRAGFGPAAESLARELGYPAAPWPEGLLREHPEADLLVLHASRPVPGGAP